MLDISIAAILGSLRTSGIRMGVFLKNEDTRIRFHKEVLGYFGTSGMVIKKNQETIYLNNQSIINSFGAFREQVDKICGYRFQIAIIEGNEDSTNGLNDVFRSMMSFPSNFSLIGDLQQKSNKKIPDYFLTETAIMFIEEGDFKKLETK